MTTSPRALLLALGLALITFVAVPGPALGRATGTVPTALLLVAPESAYVGEQAEATATLTRDDTPGDATDPGTPVAGALVRFTRGSGAAAVVQDVVTDEAGVARLRFRVTADADANTVAAAFDGDPELAPSAAGPVVVGPLRRPTLLVLDGPARVVDETRVALRVRWRAAPDDPVRPGEPVPGAVRLQRRAGGEWRTVARTRLGADGEAKVRVGPRDDTRYRALGQPGAWWRGATSRTHDLDNVPPIAPVAYPAAAPRPRVRLPEQARAVGAGPNAQVSGISNGVWRSMVGRSWHRGCPVGRASLRLVRINYWGYDGYRRRGELVVRSDIAGKTVGAFSALYRARLPLRSMYRIDRFGWSSYLEGGDNYRSMAAGNTSGFNCRGVVGNPGVRSPHTYGRAIDLNPWENPYRSRRGTVPNTWWASRSHPRIAWRSASHPVVRIMRAYGFRWTYGTGDSQHFDG